MKTKLFANRAGVWLILSLALGLLLAACGNNTVAPASTTAATSPAAGATTAAAGATTAAAAPAGGVVDLSLWMYPSAPEGAAPPADWEGYKIIRDKLGINLKFTMIPVGGDGDTKLNAAAASNSLPDIFEFQNRNRNLFFQYVDQGLLAPTASLLPMMPERTKARYSNDNLNKLVTVNGTMYGLQESADLTKRTGLVIRQDWLDKLGLKAPTTLDEFYEVAKAFTEKDPDGNGKADTYGFGAALESGVLDTNFGLKGSFDFIYGAYGLPGAWNFADMSKFGPNVRDPNYQKATEFVKKLVDAKVVDPDWSTLKLDDFRARWKQGKYGMFIEDFCALQCVANYKDFDTNNPNGSFKIVDPPKGPNGKNAIGTFAPTGRSYAISKKALDGGKAQTIAKLLEWANSGEGYYLLGFGKEGLNYKKDASGNVITEGIDPKLVYNSKEQQPILQMKWLAYAGTPVELRARYVVFQTKNGRTIDPLDYYKAANGSAYVDGTAGQLIKSAPNQADIDRYVSENLVQFVVGQKPLNDASWGDFVKSLDKVGFSDWEASAKKALQTGGFIK